MFFWVFMLIFDLMIPVMMIGFGKFFIQKAPQEVNGVFGYRTTMSMKNKDTWEFAHHYCGKLWFASGKIMLVTSLIAMLFVIGRDTDTVGIFGGILCGIQTVIMIGSIFPTEIALKHKFDRYGNIRK